MKVFNIVSVAIVLMFTVLVSSLVVSAQPDFRQFSPVFTSNIGPTNFFINDEGCCTGDDGWFAFRNNTASSARTTTTPFEIIMDINVTNAVDVILVNYSVIGSAAGQPNRDPNIWQIEISTDNITYNVIDFQTGQTTWGAGEERTFGTNRNASFAARYIKFLYILNNGDATDQLAEVRYRQNLAPPAPSSIAQPQLTVFANDIYDSANLTNFTVTVYNATATFTNRTNTGSVVFSRLANVTNYNVTFNATSFIGITDRLVSYWNFDNNVGDLVGQGQGTAEGGLTCTIEGINQQACEFDGVNDYVNASNDASLNIVNQITMMAWVKPVESLVSGNHFIISKTSDDFTYGMSMFESSRAVELQINNTFTNANAALSSTNYTHVAVVFDSDTNRALFYYNGTLVRNNSHVANMVPNLAETLTLGVTTQGGPASGFWNGSIDELKIYNRTLTSAEIQSEFDNSRNFLFTNQEYFNATGEVFINSSTSFIFSPFQVYAVFNATQIYSRFSINGFNITDGNQSNTTTGNQATLLLKAGTFSFNANATGHLNNTIAFTFNALDNVTNLYDFGNAIFNFTAVDNTTGEFIQTGYTVNVSVVNLTGSFAATTTSANIINFPFLLGHNYTVIGNFTDNVFQSVVLNQVAAGNVTLSSQAVGTIAINVFNEQTREPFNVSNPNLSVSFEFVGPTATNFSSLNGTLVVGNLIAGEYEIRYSAEGFKGRSFFVDLPTLGSSSVNLFLLDDSNATAIELTVKDENFDVVENATVQLLRFYITTNSFEVVEMTRTGFDGTSTVNLKVDEPFYKFRILVEGLTKLTTIGTKISTAQSTNGLNFQVNLQEDALATIEELEGVSTSLNYSVSITSFVFGFVDTQNVLTESCLEVTLRDNLSSRLVNASCSTSSSGTIVLAIDRNVGGTYTAQGILKGTSTAGNTFDIIADQISRNFDLEDVVNTFGPLIYYLMAYLIMAVALSQAFDPRAVIVGSSLGFLIVVFMGLTVFTGATAIGVIFLAAFLGIIVTPKST